MKIAGSYFGEQYATFAGSLRIDKRILMTYLYDMLYYLALVSAFAVWGLLVKAQSTQLQYIDYGSIMNLDALGLEETRAVLQSFLFFLVVSIALLLVFMLLGFSFFKGLIWGRLLGTRIDYKYFKGFFLLNLAYFLPVLLLSLYVMLKLGNSFFIVLVPIAVHFSALLCYYFTKTNMIGKAFKEAFRIGYRVHKFLLPYAVIVIGLIALNRLFLLVNLSSRVEFLLVFVTIPFYFAWARSYFVSFMKQTA